MTYLIVGTVIFVGFCFGFEPSNDCSCWYLIFATARPECINHVSLPQSTSAACGGSIYPVLPPPVTTSTALPSTTSLSPPPLPHTTHTTTTSNSITITSMQLSNAALNFRSSPLYTTAAEVKVVRSYSSSRTSSPGTSLRGSRRGTPSPPASFTYRSSSSSGSVRNSPYTSPRDSPRGTHRGSPRTSPHNSAHTSPRNSTHGSPPPSLSLTFGNGNDLRSGSHSPPAVTLSPSQLSPPVMRKSLLISNSGIIIMYLFLVVHIYPILEEMKICYTLSALFPGLITKLLRILTFIAYNILAFAFWIASE